VKLYRRCADKLRMLMIDRPLPPPHDDELELVRELKALFAAFSPIEGVNASPSEAAWICNLNRLRELVINGNPRKFLRWDVIQKTMFVSSAPYVEEELRFLKSCPDWGNRWRGAIEESPAGHPFPFLSYPDSSGNLIHHAYHLAQFEEKSGIRVDKMDYVLEFGGGYGSLCRLFHKLGFQGKYVIFDLPYFSALQQFYLKSLAIPVHAVDGFITANKGVVCLSELAQLNAILSNDPTEKNSMFVATWSISEIPFYLRNEVLPMVAKFKAFLIAYQDQFEEVNNTEFFSNWRETFDKEIVWKDWPIRHIPGNNYLVGKSILSVTQ
jgi:hypothetical protein